MCGFFFTSFGQAMTQEQMDRTSDMMRKNCQPKFSVSNELVDGIKAGAFPANKDLMVE